MTFTTMRLSWPLRRLRCAFEGHEYLHWVPENDCTERSTCTRCCQSGQRVSHHWSEWTHDGITEYKGETKCVHVKTCTTCGKTRVAAIHSWRYFDGTLHFCSTCGKRENHIDAEADSLDRCTACGGKAVKRDCG
jgi:hypothetical protein